MQSTAFAAPSLLLSLAPRSRSVQASRRPPQMALAAPDPLFGRLATAMVTPFKVGDGSVDYGMAEALASHLVANGSDALIICGTTGESPTLTWSEQWELFKVVQGAVGASAKVIAGAGSNSTQEAVDATRRAAKMGLDGTLQVVPYYNKPPQEGMYRHFEAVAKCEPDLPVMLYNIPSRTGIDMTPETSVRLSKIENIVACKQASNDLADLVTIRKYTDADFHLYAGDDGMTLPFLSLGGSGVVSVAGHFVGREIQEMIRKFLGGDLQEAIAIHMKYEHLFNDLFCMSNPIPTKTCLRMLGWAVGGPRLPLVDADEVTEAKLRKLLESVDLL